MPAFKKGVLSRRFGQALEWILYSVFCTKYSLGVNQVKDDAVDSACDIPGRYKQYTHMKGGDQLG